MKISLLSSTFPPYKGGMGNVAFNEAVFMARLGHEVAVLTPRYKKTDLSADSAPGRGFSLTRLPPIVAVGNGALCAGVLDRIEDADVVYVHYPFFGAAEVAWLNRVFGRSSARGRKLIVRYDMDTVGARWQRPLFFAHTKLVMPRILKSADKVIFSTADYAATSNAARFFSEKPDKCAVVPYGVDTTLYYPDSATAKEAKTILFVGGLDRAHYFKGLADLIAALAPLIEADGEINLIVVGKGDLLPHYRQLAQSVGIPSNVRFLDDCDDDNLRRCYTRAIATVLPSVDRSESFGLALLESMACGSAVIAPSLPGVRTLVQDGVNGYLTPSPEGASPDARRQSLRSAIKRLLDDTANAKNMGLNGLEIVTKRYRWEIIANSLVRIFSE